MSMHTFQRQVRCLFRATLPWSFLFELSPWTDTVCVRLVGYKMAPPIFHSPTRIVSQYFSLTLLLNIANIATKKLILILEFPLTAVSQKRPFTLSLLLFSYLFSSCFSSSSCLPPVLIPPFFSAFYCSCHSTVTPSKCIHPPSFPFSPSLSLSHIHLSFIFA